MLKHFPGQTGDHAHDHVELEQEHDQKPVSMIILQFHQFKMNPVAWTDVSF